MFVQHQKNIATEQSPLLVRSKDFELEIVDQSLGKLKAKIHFNYLHVGFTCHVEITNTTIQLASVIPFKGIITTAPELEVANLFLDGYLDSRGAITQNAQQQIIWLMHDTIHLYNLLRLKAPSVLQLYRVVFYDLKSEYDNIEFGKIPFGSPLEQIFANRFYTLATQNYKYRYSNAVLLFRSIQNLIQNENGYFVTPLKRI
jgi:hypothetical protein